MFKQRPVDIRDHDLNRLHACLIGGLDQDFVARFSAIAAQSNLRDFWRVEEIGYSQIAGSPVRFPCKLLVNLLRTTRWRFGIDTLVLRSRAKHERRSSVASGTAP